MPLQLVLSWSCVWPRPAAACDGKTVVNMRCGDLSVSVLELQFAAENPFASPLLKRAWDLISQLLHGTCFVRLLDLFSCLQNHTELHGLLGQLLWHVGTQIDFNLGSRAMAPVKDDICKFSYLSMKEVIAADGIESFVAQYLLNACDTHRQLCPDQVFTMATDKGIVAGLPLQDTVVVLPSNAGYICAPAVFFVFRISLVQSWARQGPQHLQPDTHVHAACLLHCTFSR
jgi:hypothetical protein